MILVLAGILLLALILGPNLWVKYVLKKHHKALEQMPGTGSELARHLLNSYGLEKVKLEVAPADSDHYDPQDNAVRLSPDVFDGKSLTAIAVATHEVGHALQFGREEPISKLRGKYLAPAMLIQKMGIYIIMAMPLVGLIFRVPQAALFTTFVGVVTMFASVLLYVAMLPEEWDASFNKALPILDEGDYVPKEYLPAIKQVLTACAMTYVAAALMNILNLWRWFRLLR